MELNPLDKQTIDCPIHGKSPVEQKVVFGAGIVVIKKWIECLHCNVESNSGCKYLIDAVFARLDVVLKRMENGL